MGYCPASQNAAGRNSGARDWKHEFSVPDAFPRGARRPRPGVAYPDLESYLHGQSAVVMGDTDVSAAAKVLKNFTAEFQKPKLKVGILDKAVLDVPSIMALADLPSKEVLQAKLLGLLMAPASTLVRLINTPASQVAQVLKAYSEKGEKIAA